MSNNNTCYIIDNASIHKTRNVDQYAKRNKISLLTIPPYSPALNGSETVIQAIKAKVNKRRIQRKVNWEKNNLYFRVLSLNLIADVVNELEKDGLSKYFQQQRLEILSELKTKLK